MKILSDSNKVIIEADSKKITFRNVFLNKVINIKDIESMYIFNDTMYVLYKQNKLYRKPLARMKLSQKEELKEAYRKASQPHPAAVPLDWMETKTPEKWQTYAGRREYNF